MAEEDEQKANMIVTSEGDSIMAQLKKKIEKEIKYTCPECSCNMWGDGEEHNEKHYCLCSDGYWSWSDSSGWLWIKEKRDTSSKEMSENCLEEEVLVKEYEIEKRKHYIRYDDMSHCKKALDVYVQMDGDVFIGILNNGNRTEEASVEFCSIGGGGGLSPNTRKAIGELIVAIQKDNEENPYTPEKSFVYEEES